MHHFFRFREKENFAPGDIIVKKSYGMLLSDGFDGSFESPWYPEVESKL